MFNSKRNIPKKPPTQKGQIDMLWDAVWNHLPSQINILGIKMNFTLIFMGLILAFNAALIVLVVRAI